MVNLLAIALLPALFVGVTAFILAWVLKPHPLKGKTLLVGIRPSTETSAIRAVNTTRGVYEWKEKGDFKADVHLDNAFLFNGRVRIDGKKAEPDATLSQVSLQKAQTWDDRALGMKVVIVDLDTTQPIKYEGACKNDDEVVTVDYFGAKKELRFLWSRLTGVRLYQIRKDLRLRQLAAVATSMWEFLTKAMPLIMVAFGIVLLVVLVLVIKVAL